MGAQVLALARYALSAALRYVPSDPVAGRTVVDALRQVLLSGTAVTVPFVVTLVVLGVVVDFVADLLAPFVSLVSLVPLFAGLGPWVATGATLGLLVGLVFLTGVVVESGPETGIGARASQVMEAIPAVGSVYTSFDRMSAVMLESDNESFREVKLIEFPNEGLYSLAFQTAELDGGADVGDDGLLVLFVPLAPNPVMGGFMVVVSRDRVQDVEMSIQEAFQAIVTSGVAMSESTDDLLGVPAGDVELPEGTVDAVTPVPGGTAAEPSRSESP